MRMAALEEFIRIVRLRRAFTLEGVLHGCRGNAEYHHALTERQNVSPSMSLSPNAKVPAPTARILPYTNVLVTALPDVVVVLVPAVINANQATASDRNAVAG